MKKDINYSKNYSIFKKLPNILAIVTAALVLIWSIVDVAVFKSGYDYNYFTGAESYRYHGVMKIPSVFLALLIWWAIGAVAAFATRFFCALTIAPTVLRTDATIAIEGKIQGDEIR